MNSAAVCVGVGSMSGIGLTIGRGTKVGLTIACAVVFAGLATGLGGAGGLLVGTRRDRGTNILRV